MLRSAASAGLVSLTGAQGVIACEMMSGDASQDWSVGHLISIVHQKARLIGVVCELATADRRWTDSGGNVSYVTVELSGEIVDDERGTPQFYRGIRSYPALGSIAHRMRADDLKAIYSFRGAEGVEIGRLSQNTDVPAIVSVDELVSRHFAVIGSTGSGKTTAVSMLIKKCLAKRPKLRVLIIDPHNEYAKHFPRNSVLLNSDNLELPYWMFKFDEMADIIYNGRKPNSDETDALYDVIKTAKAQFVASSAGSIGASPVRRNAASDFAWISADTPVPYRVADMVHIIDEWLGKLDQRYPRSDLRALKHRLESLSRDPRFRFMFGRVVVEDNMAKVISRIFRLPKAGAPVSIIQLAGLPNEVVDSLVSVLARMAFEIALVERGLLRDRRGVRRSASLRADRPVAVLRTDPPGDRPHRQGRPQIRRLARHRHPAPVRARFDRAVAVLDHVRDAPRQRTRQGDRAFGGRRLFGQHDRLPLFDRRPRGDRLRRGDRDADADEIRRLSAGGGEPAVRRPTPSRIWPISICARSSAGCAANIRPTPPKRPRRRI